MRKSEIFREILDIVCSYAEVTQEDVLSMSRKEDLVTARCLIAMYCKAYGLSNKYIQEKLKQKCHGTISNYFRMYRDRRATDRGFRHLDYTIGQELANIMPTTDE